MIYQALPRRTLGIKILTLSSTIQLLLAGGFGAPSTSAQGFGGTANQGGGFAAFAASSASGFFLYTSTSISF